MIRRLVVALDRALAGKLAQQTATDTRALADLDLDEPRPPVRAEYRRPL